MQQHLAARRIREYYAQLSNGWIGTRDREPLFPNEAFQQWVRETMRKPDQRDLVKLVKQECRAFAAVLLAAAKQRFASIWDYIQSLELIDPLGPALEVYATPQVWDAFKDLCSRRGIDFYQCQREIVSSREAAQQLHESDKSRIRADLLSYLQETRVVEEDLTALDQARIAVFSISLTSAFVESLFSKMEYNQSKVRSRMKAGTMSSVLHVHDALLEDPRNPLAGTVKLKTSVPSVGEEQKAKKWIGTRVCKEFEIQTVEGLSLVRFHGVVSKIKYHEIHGRWMYHVVYEDGDESDYWRYELTDLLCKCDDEQTTMSDIL